MLEEEEGIVMARSLLEALNRRGGEESPLLALWQAAIDKKGGKKKKKKTMMTPRFVYALHGFFCASGLVGGDKKLGLSCTPSGGEKAPEY